MKRIAIAAAFAACILALDAAGVVALKVWKVTDTPTAFDLNANFAKLHDHMRGLTHGLVRDSDVSSSAKLSHAKLAAYVRLPRAIGATDGLCSDYGPCRMRIAYGLRAADGGIGGAPNYTGVTHLDAGIYSVNLNFPVSAEAILVNSEDDGGTATSSCNAYGPANNHGYGLFYVACVDEVANTRADRPFSFSLWTN